ncbi:hypothetical protein HY631_04530 [Candidatus Uhrbacteria bacterium]|nr:hypothetical protein [Candidatus Uhrbacteria bacterium]
MTSRATSNRVSEGTAATRPAVAEGNIEPVYDVENDTVILDFDGFDSDDGNSLDGGGE